MTKTCSRCKETKSLDSFYSRRSSKDGKDRYCKRCKNIMNKASPNYEANHLKACANYRKNRRDRVRESWRKYKAAHPDRVLSNNTKWAKANPEKRKKSNQKYREANRDRVAAAQAIRSSRWYEKNKEDAKKYIREWQIANPELRTKARRNYYVRHTEKIVLYRYKRQDRRDNATPKWSVPFFLNEAYDLARLRTKITGIKWDVDHIVPIVSDSVCGLHAHTNIRVITRLINGRKSNLYWPDMPE